MGDLDIRHSFKQLPNEKPKTFQALVAWVYSAYLLGSYLPRLSLNYDLDLLFELYAFAHAHLITKLQDAIISALYDKFAKDSNTAPREARWSPRS